MQTKTTLATALLFVALALLVRDVSATDPACVPRCLAGTQQVTADLVGDVATCAGNDCTLAWSAEYTPCTQTYVITSLAVGATDLTSDTTITSFDCVQFGATHGLRLDIDIGPTVEVRFEWAWNAASTAYLCDTVLSAGLAPSGYDSVTFAARSISSNLGGESYLTLGESGSFANDHEDCDTGVSLATATPTPSNTPSVSLTSSVTASTSPTPSNTPSVSESSSSTPSASVTASNTPSVSQSSSETTTGTPTASNTPSVSESSSVSLSATQTPSISQSITLSSTQTPTQTATSSPSGSTSGSVSGTVTASQTATASSTPSWLHSPSATASNTPSISDTASVTPSSSVSISYTATASATATPSSTVSVSFTATSSNTASASITASATPSNSATASIYSSHSGTPSQTPSISQSATATASVTASGTPTGTASGTASGSVTTTGTPSTSRSATPSSSEEPVEAQAYCGDGIINGAEQCDYNAEVVTCCTQSCTFASSSVSCDDGGDDDECGAGHCAGDAARCDFVPTPETCMPDCDVHCFAQTRILALTDGDGPSSEQFRYLMKFVPCANAAPFEMQTIFRGETVSVTPTFACTVLSGDKVRFSFTFGSELYGGYVRWIYHHGTDCDDVARTMFDARVEPYSITAHVAVYDEATYELTDASPETMTGLENVCEPEDVTFDEELCLSGARLLTSFSTNSLTGDWPCPNSGECEIYWTLKVVPRANGDLDVISFTAGVGSTLDDYTTFEPFTTDTSVEATITRDEELGVGVVQIRSMPSASLKLSWLYAASDMWSFSASLPASHFLAHIIELDNGNGKYVYESSAASERITQLDGECPVEEPPGTPVTRAIVPFVTCYTPRVLNDDRCLTVFGYRNDNFDTIEIAAETPENVVVPEQSLVLEQPSEFINGIVDEAFAVVSSRCEFYDKPVPAKWTLTTQLDEDTLGDTTCSATCGELSSYLRECVLAEPNVSEVSTRCARKRHDTPRCNSDQIQRWLGA